MASGMIWGYHGVKTLPLPPVSPAFQETDCKSRPPSPVAHTAIPAAGVNLGEPPHALPYMASGSSRTDSLGEPSTLLFPTKGHFLSFCCCAGGVGLRPCPPGSAVRGWKTDPSVCPMVPVFYLFDRVHPPLPLRVRALNSLHSYL